MNDDEKNLDELDENQDPSRTSGDEDQQKQDDTRQPGKGDDKDDDLNPSDEETDDEDPPRQTRRERRQERYENLRQQTDNGFKNRDNARNNLYGRDDPYNPIDYGKSEEYDADELKQDRERYGKQQARQAADLERRWNSQERFQDRLESDADYVTSRYSFMDEHSDDFDPDLAKRINSMYLRTVGFDNKTGMARNTDIRYRDHVREMVDALDNYAANRNADTSRNLAQQRSRTGIRPNGSRAKQSSSIESLMAKDPNKLSNDELDRVLKHINS